MNKKELEAFAREAAKGIKTEKDLNAELDDHLGYDKHAKSSPPNSRNGTTPKTLRTEDGQFTIETLRDRDCSFCILKISHNPPTC